MSRLIRNEKNQLQFETVQNELQQQEEVQHFTALLL